MMVGGICLLGLSIIALGVLLSKQQRDLFSNIDAIARYFFGVVGAFLAGWALYSLDGLEFVKLQVITLGELPQIFYYNQD